MLSALSSLFLVFKTTWDNGGNFSTHHFCNIDVVIVVYVVFYSYLLLRQQGTTRTTFFTDHFRHAEVVIVVSVVFYLTSWLYYMPIHT